MKKLLNVDKTFSGMRIDRFLRNHFGQIPQSLIEKNLRNGKIKLNNSISSLNRIFLELLIFFLFNLIFPFLRFFSIRLCGIWPK